MISENQLAHIIERTNKHALLYTTTDLTMRQIALKTKTPLSTVSKDLLKFTRLYCPYNLHLQVMEKAKTNKLLSHNKGGEATKQKYINRHANIK